MKAKSAYYKYKKDHPIKYILSEIYLALPFTGGYNSLVEQYADLKYRATGNCINYAPVLSYQEQCNPETAKIIDRDCRKKISELW